MAVGQAMTSEEPIPWVCEWPSSSRTSEELLLEVLRLPDWLTLSLVEALHLLLLHSFFFSNSLSPWLAALSWTGPAKLSPVLSRMRKTHHRFFVHLLA